MREILIIFQQYTGSGFLTILYLITLLYLWVTEKNNTVRSIFVYGASALQILFFLPPMYYGYQLLDRGTYYRILWLLPMTVTIAYAGIRLLGKYPRFGIAFGVFLIAVSGKYVYSSEYITLAENPYHLPQEVIEVCEVMMPEENQERVTAVFPDDLIHYIRQYTSEIQMVYGRDYLVPDWIYGDHPIRELMNEETIDMEEVAKRMEDYYCNYIVVPKNKEIMGDLKKCDLVLIGETKEYEIYRNDRVEILYKRDGGDNDESSSP